MKTYKTLAAAGVLLAIGPAFLHAQQVPLPSTWGEYDLQQQQNYSPGLMTLSGQSSSGFSATVASNGIAPAYPSKSQYLPRVYAFFANQPITNLGSRVTVSFDVVFNTVADPSNAGSFRVTLGDTNANNSLIGCWSIGNSLSTINRYANTITKDTNWFNSVNGYYLFAQPNPSDANNLSMGSLSDGGLNMSVSALGAQPPNGVGLGTDVTNVHHLKLSVERTQNGLQDDLVWNNSAGTNVFESAGRPTLGGNGDDNSGQANILPWTGVNILGFCLFGTGSNEHFFGNDPGTFTVSNLKVYYGFSITSFERDPSTGDATIAWESSLVDTCQYEVQSSADLSSWTTVATVPSMGYSTSYTDSGTSGQARFYRVNKVF